MTWGANPRKKFVDQGLKAPHPSFANLPPEERRAKLLAANGIPPRPELWQWLVPLYYGWSTLGRDMNGLTLYSERQVFLDRAFDDPGEREAGECLLMVLEGEAAEIHAELHPPPKGAK